MKGLLFGLLAVIIVMGGLWFAKESGVLDGLDMQKNGVLGTDGTMKNIEMLLGERRYTVATSSVNYFENAQGLLARPAEAGGYPGVVMIHENRGLRSGIRAAAEDLASHGYIVLAVDLYKGQVAEEEEQARAIQNSIDLQEATRNLRTAISFLRSQGATKIASLGWAFGGRQSVNLAISGEPLDATVVYYGGGIATTTARLAPIDWPVLGIFGGADQAIPVEMVEAFEASLNELGIKNEIYIYPGVGQGFANSSSMSYAPEEAKDAWAKTLDFLERHLK